MNVVQVSEGYMYVCSCGRTHWKAEYMAWFKMFLLFWFTFHISMQPSALSFSIPYSFFVPLFWTRLFFFCLERRTRIFEANAFDIFTFTSFPCEESVCTCSRPRAFCVPFIMMLMSNFCSDFDWRKWNKGVKRKWPIYFIFALRHVWAELSELDVISCTRVRVLRCCCIICSNYVKWMSQIAHSHTHTQKTVFSSILNQRYLFTFHFQCGIFPAFSSSISTPQFFFVLFFVSSYCCLAPTKRKFRSLCLLLPFLLPAF